MSAAKTSTPGVYKRGGKYAYVIRVDGKQRWVSGFATQREAKAARIEALDRIAKGADVAPDKVTVSDYLAGWLEVQRGQLKPLTHDSYTDLVARYITPAIGHQLLQKLTAPTLTAFYDQLHRAGGHKGKPLSLRTVKYTHAVVRKSLGDALADGRVLVNVATAAKLPKIAHRADPMALPIAARPPLKVWTAEQVNTFQQNSASHRLAPAFMLALNTGLRRGELFGLRWDDLDEHGDGTATLHVRQSLLAVGGRLELSTPKNGKARSFKIGRRTYDLLRQQRAAQAADQLAWHGPWQNNLGLVFTAEDGSPLSVRWMSQLFGRLAKRAGVPQIRHHDTRHTYATLALQAGVNIKVVSQRLGHSSVQLTWDTYAHVLPDQDDAAAEQFEAHVYGL